GAGGCHHSVTAADRPLPAEDHARDTPAKAVARPLCHPVGQATSDAGLCPELLRCARGLYAPGAADHATGFGRGGAVLAAAGPCRGASSEDVGYRHKADLQRRPTIFSAFGGKADIAPKRHFVRL